MNKKEIEKILKKYPKYYECDNTGRWYMVDTMLDIEIKDGRIFLSTDNDGGMGKVWIADFPATEENIRLFAQIVHQ